MNYKIKLLFLSYVCLIIGFTDVKAQNNFVRVCRYYRPEDKTTIYLKWESETKYPLVYDENGNFLTGINTINNTEKVFDDSCPSYLVYHETIYDKLHTPSEKKSKDAFVFDGVITAGRDVYYSETYKENRDNPNNNSYINKKVSCSYVLKNGFKFEVTVDTKGKITSSATNKKGKNAKVILDNPGNLLTIISETSKCPTTICYNENLGRKDRVTLFADINHNCKSVRGGSTNSNAHRTTMSEQTLGAYPSAAERARGQILKEESKQKSNKYIDCLEKIDEGTNGNRICYDIRAYKNRVCGSDSSSNSCIERHYDYIKCVEEAYPKEEIDKVCFKEVEEYKKAQDELVDYANETGDETVRSYINLNYDSGGIGTDINYDDIDCGQLLGSELLEWLSSIYFLIQVGAIAITVITGMLDITKAVASNEEDMLKKALNKLKIRLLVTVIIIILPILIEFILGFVEIPGLTNKNPLCE